MINVNTKTARLAAVFGCAITLGLSVLAAAAPAHAGTVTPDATSSHTFVLVNQASGYCMGIEGGSSTVGTDAVQWNCNGNPDQQWSIRSIDNVNGLAYFQIENNDNLCLGVAGGSATEGAGLVGFTCLGTNHQDQWWEFNSGPVNNSPCPGYIYLQNLKDGYVIGTQGGSLAEGAHLVQWKFQNTCNNQWWDNE